MTPGEDVPSVDRQIGIEGYATGFEGIGGRIRVRRKDFRVEEILDGGTFSRITKSPTPSNRYPVYRLVKEGIDTLHALQQVRRRFGWRVTYLGLKDADAQTVQYITPRQRGGDGQPSLRVSSKVLLELEGYIDGFLTRRSLAGNRFTIRVSGVGHNAEVVESAAEELGRAIEEMRIPNFFGYQRFGTRRPVNHLVGRELLRGRFEEAVMIFLTYRSSQEDGKTGEMREEMEDPACYPSILNQLGRSLDMERRLVAALIDHPGAWSRALRAVPITVRRLFVNAYQSYLFNRLVSRMLREGSLTEGEDGDVYGRLSLKDGSLTEILRGRRASSEVVGEKVLPLVQLVGYAYRSGDGYFDRITQSILKEEEISPKMFYIREMPELSMEGGFRVPPLIGGEFNAEFEPGEETSCLLRFRLLKGSYATVPLRELMKPVDPVSAGF